MKNNQTKKHVTIALLAAIVVVLQVLCTFVRFGPFSITLALTPIIVGAAVYGVGAGALLGLIFGFVVLITGVFGWDGGTVMLLMGLNAPATILICLGKGLAAGYVAGVLHRLFVKKNSFVAALVSALACPIVNTGLFLAGMSTFFMSTLESWASGENMMVYIIFGLTGMNFLVELVSNLALSTGIARIIREAKR